MLAEMETEFMQGIRTY